MTVFVNDQPRALAANTALVDLLRELGLAEKSEEFKKTGGDIYR